MRAAIKSVVNNMCARVAVVKHAPNDRAQKMDHWVFFNRVFIAIFEEVVISQRFQYFKIFTQGVTIIVTRFKK